MIIKNEINKEIAISVVVAVHNAAEYLRECLDTICKQTLDCIEIICIDDGSTDTSKSILQQYHYKDNRIKILSQDNKGAGAARNAGLKIAKGKYLLFLDADDFFDFSLLQKMYEKAESTTADIVICSAKEFNHKTKEISPMSIALNSDYLPHKDVFSYKDMPEYIFNSFQNWAWNKLFRADFIKNNNIHFQEIQRTNDLLFTCTALVLATRIVTVTEELIYYRTNHGGNCQATNSKAPKDFVDAFIALKMKLYDFGVYEDVRKSYLNWALKSCIHNLISINDLDSEKRLLRYLSQQGIKELGFNDFKIMECYEKRDYLKLILIKYNMWPLLKWIRKIKKRTN